MQDLTKLSQAKLRLLQEVELKASLNNNGVPTELYRAVKQEWIRRGNHERTA